MVLGMRTQRRFDVIVKDDKPMLVDVTDLGDGYGYDSAVQLREAFIVAAHSSNLPIEITMKRFDSLIKRLLCNQLGVEDVVHHSKIKL